ncbi:MAG: ABC transporter ATP-binding protein [Actinobacteria bacterium]|nr:MAG: ABC transporter ATP-binding protein [Actinomycetota bacterium]
MSAILAKGLTKRYGELSAVDGLDLQIDRGVLYGFLGPNGAGKTTTIRMLLGLIFPTGGEVRVLDQPVFGHEGSGSPALRKVGALIEEPAFWMYLSGRRNLEYFTRAAGPRSEQQARLARIDDVLHTVGLADAANKRVKAYSQGMRQRLGIALALLGEPELLVLDEPTNGLDPQGMREIRLLLRRLAGEGTTVFVSSHLLSEVEAMCDRVGVLAQGRLVADGPPDVLRKGADVIRLDIDDATLARGVLGTLAGVAIEPGDGLRVRLSPPATAASVNAALVAGGVAVSALVPEQAGLEDVFLSLVEGADAPR